MWKLWNERSQFKNMFKKMKIGNFISYLEKMNKDLREVLSLDVECIPLCLKSNIAVVVGKNSRYITQTLIKLYKIEDFCEIRRLGKKIYFIKFQDRL